MMRVFLEWGYPNSWMVYFMENPIYKWMRTGGTTSILYNWGYSISREIEKMYLYRNGPVVIRLVSYGFIVFTVYI